MNSRLLFTLLLFSFASGAAAYTDAGLKYTFGPDGYAGFNASAEWGSDAYYLRPAMNTYKSEGADRYSAYSFGAGLDRETWGAGAELSLTPETGGYKNAAFSADFTLNLLPLPEEGAALQDASVGVFAALTAHEDAYSLSTTTALGSGRRSGRSALTDSFKLNQTDYGLTASVKAYGLRASGKLGKTAYNKDITAEARQLPLEIGGIGTSGFPDTAVSARLRAPGLLLAPEAGYARTSYLLGQPSSESLTLGISYKTGPATLSATWENFNPGGGAARSEYWSLGLSMAF